MGEQKRRFSAAQLFKDLTPEQLKEVEKDATELAASVMAVLQAFADDKRSEGMGTIELAARLMVAMPYVFAYGAATIAKVGGAGMEFLPVNWMFFQRQINKAFNEAMAQGESPERVQ